MLVDLHVDLMQKEQISVDQKQIRTWVSYQAARPCKTNRLLGIDHIKGAPRRFTN